MRGEWKKRAAVLAALAAAGILVLWYAKGEGRMEKFKWIPTECAPRKYPVKIIEGDFIFKNGRSIYIPDGKLMSNGWGETGSAHVVGEDFKPIPVKMEICWFSYTEDKFYAGSFDLPYRKILNLFREGFTESHTKEKTTYNGIIAGMAPGGEISLWVVGAGTTVEVASFQAREADIDWKRVLDNPDTSRQDYIRSVLLEDEDFSEEELASLKKTGVPQGLFKNKYRERYDWKHRVVGAPKIFFVTFDMFNGERLPESSGLLESAVFPDRAVPKSAAVGWFDSAGRKLTQEIHFDETEIFEAFHKFQEMNPGGTYEMELQISSASTLIWAFLEDETHRVEFEKTTLDTRYVYD
jgi:hypothetical protein